MGKKFIVYLLAISMFVGNADYMALATEETVYEAAESTDETQDNEETEANTEERRIENPSSDVETELQNLEEIWESEVTEERFETENQTTENTTEENFETSESEDAKEETEEETEESLTEESLTEDNTVLGAEEVTIVQVEMQGVYEYGDSPLDYQKEYGDSVVYSMRSNNVVEYAYQEIMKSYEAGESGTEIAVSEYGFSVEDIIRLVGGLKNDHPELYFVNKSFYCTWSGMDVASIIVSYNTSLSPNKFKQSTEDALSVIKPEMSDLEKAIALHDYLTVNCEYDKDRLDDETIPYISYTAYGVLVEHIAVCQGYALAYKYLLNQAGIDCYMVESDSMKHAWNLIVLDGEFYQVDVTWDDPIRDLVGRSRHTYMFRSDSAFENANPSHSNWNVTSGMDIVDYKAISTRYDSAFWAECNSPLVITENDCYYVSYKDKAIKKERFENIGGTGTKVCDIGEWPVWDNNNSAWNATFSGLFQVNDRLYYNDKTSIYSVDFDGSNKKTEFTADTTTGYIYGSALRQGKVYYCLRQKPNITVNETVLTADIRFNTKKYTITFDADSGSVDISHKTVLPNKACGTLPIPKRDGYNFAGWYTERNGTGERITAETIITQSITVYAKWDKPVIMHTVTYDMQGHGEQVSSETVKEGAKLSEPSVPTAKDYTFGGWYKEKICQTAWDFAKDTVTKDTTLYAKWVENIKPVITYKVTYDMQGHGEQVSPETVEKGSKLIKPATPVAKGYTFEGWYKEKTCQTEWDFAKDIVTKDTTLYAKWVENVKPVITYKVTYDMQGHGEQVPPETVKEGSKLSEPSVPTAKDYTFGGWYKEKTCQTEWDFAKDTVTKDTTLYAKWVENVKPVITYKVTYDMQGHGEQIESETVEKGSKLIEPAIPVAKDYTFGGWYKEKTCQTAWDFAKDTVTKDATLYAKWVENAKPVTTYKVTYDMQGHGEQISSETVEEGLKLIEPSIPIAKDYTFEGWYKEKTCQTEWDFAKDTVTKDTTLYAKWVENAKPVITYKVTYDMQGHGEQIEPETVEKGSKLIEPATPAAKNYTFEGWYKEKTCETAWDFAKDTVTKDTTLYAKWVENVRPVITYKVTYDMQGHGEQVSPETVKEGTKLIEPSAPTAKDYTFWGWYKEKNCQTEWDFAKDTITKDTTLYAKWVENVKPVITYKVMYDMQGHGEQIKSETVEEGAKLSEPSTPTAKDYTFWGWYKEKTCQTAWDFAKDTVTKDMTLYAKWVENVKPVITYKVTYDMQGHGDQVSSETVEEGTKLIEPATPVAKDYRFLGWFKEPKCINIWDFTKDAVNNDITLYAGWSYLGNTSTGDLPEDGVPEGLWIAGIQDYTYTGKAIKPQIRVYFKETKLKEGQDYTISYKNNIKAAGMDDKKAPTVTIKGKGNYAGTAVKTFTINKAMLTASNLKAASVYQMNKAYTPIIILNGNVLKDKTDYTLTYKDTNGTVLQKQPTKELGSYIMHIEGKGNCGGSFDFNFKIAEKGSASIEKGTAVVGAIIYGGKNPPTMLSVNGKTLTSSDYTVVFSNTNAKGTATATFIGIGKYTGILKKNFMVIAQPLSINNITVAKSVSYEKGGARPEISVKANKTKLSEGVDYTVSYKNNTKLGNTAKAIVKGKGNYSGSISVDFEIKGKSLNDKNMEIVIPDVVTGKKPLVTIYDTNGKKLSPGSDYEAKIDQVKHTVMITGGKNGCYTGTVSKTYSELPADKIITSVKLNKNASGFLKDYNAYTGKAVTLKNEWLTVKAKNTVLPSDCFTLSYVNNVEKGTAIVIVQGKNGYSGTKVMSFKIKAYGLKDILTWFDPKTAP